MPDIKQLSIFTKSVFLVAGTLLGYGYLCRLTGLYFFWESKTLGWIVLLIALMCFLVERIKSNRKEGKKVLSERIFIGCIVFILFVQSILFFVTPTTGAYAAATAYISADEDIKSELGEIKEFFLMPVGGMTTSSGAEGQSGEADLNVTVKGNKKYKDIYIHLYKRIETNWIVDMIE